MINYHRLNPVHTSLNDIDWPRKGREKDNVKIKRAVSYMPYAQHLMDFLKTCTKRLVTKSRQYAKSAVLTRCNKLVVHYNGQWWFVREIPTPSSTLETPPRTIRSRFWKINWTNGGSLRGHSIKSSLMFVSMTQHL